MLVVKSLNLVNSFIYIYTYIVYTLYIVHGLSSYLLEWLNRLEASLQIPWWVRLSYLPMADSILKHVIRSFNILEHVGTSYNIILQHRITVYKILKLLLLWPCLSMVVKHGFKNLKNIGISQVIPFVSGMWHLIANICFLCTGADWKMILPLGDHTIDELL